jgi:tetratricopeptide (TPR) repeat protein
MQNKKATMIAMATLSVIAFVVLYIFMVQKYKEQQGGKNRDEVATEIIAEKKLDLPKLECGQLNDSDAYKKAIVERNMDFCGCIQEDGPKSTCQETMLDAELADQALTQMNQAICNEIKIKERKEGCLAVVGQGIAYLKINDPKRLAQLNSQNHNNDYAISSYEELLKESTNDIKNYIELASAYAEKGLAEQGQGRSQSPYVEKAFATIEKAKAIDNNNAEVYRVEGYINEIKPDYIRAIYLYDKTIEIDAKSSHAYVGRGHTKRMMGILEGAVEDFRKAAELDVDKDIISIYTNLCNLEGSRSNYEEAIKNCKIVTEKKEIDPVFQSDAYQLMAMIFMRNKDYIQAKNYLLTAKTLTPLDANLFVKLSRLSILEEKYGEAESNARRAVELSPTKAMSYLALSQVLYMQEKYQESIAAAEKGISLVKNDVSLLAPSKPATERDLNYSISNNYGQLGNAEKQNEYEQKGLEVFNMNNK